MSDQPAGPLAVLAGDIVRSSDLTTPALDAVFLSLSEADDALTRLQGFGARLTRFRGDGWQMVAAPRFAFRAALLARAAVRRTAKGRDTRLALAIGDVDRLGDTLGAAAGPAFLTSGRLLETLRGHRRMAAAGSDDMILGLADGIIAGWTAKQAEVAFGLLTDPGRTQEAVASHLNVSRQIVQRQADAARLWALDTALALWEESNVFELLSTKATE